VAEGDPVDHNVLRFTNTVWNAGPGKLVVRGVIDPTTRNGPATQRVYDDAGGFTSYPVGTFEWHGANHQHYHFDDWGEYQLWTRAAYDQWVADGRPPGEGGMIGTKTTSCVMDEEFIKTLPGTPWPAIYPSDGCSPNSQNIITEGLSVGWGDTYDYYRFEQWIDLGANGTLANGQYVLRSVTDPLNKIYESRAKSDVAREGQLDNEATTTFSIAGGKLVDSHAPGGTISINHVSDTTTTPTVAVQAIGRDDVSGVDQVRLSNNGSNWATYSYTGVQSTAMNISWDLAERAYGGSAANGTRTVYAQFRDRTGKWSPTITDTITLDTGTITPATGTITPATGASAPPITSGGALPRITGGVAAAFRLSSRGTRIVRLTVRNVPGGTKLRLRCTTPKRRVTGARCPFTRATLSVAKRRNVAVVKRFKGRWLAPRTSIRIYATAPGKVGHSTRFTLRRGKRPIRSTGCVRSWLKRVRC
jgi:hypothetical protein